MENERKILDAIMKNVTLSDYIEVGSAYTFLKTLSQMIEDMGKIIRPEQMQDNFNLAWQAYSKFAGGEHKIVLKNLLGDNFERVTGHENGSQAIICILDRIEESGGIVLGETPDVEVDDIIEQMIN